ncbi:UDP-N-acetylglucosamine--undecaprenyl-phosphate N-acetylglucosaminephosphotransferase [Shewanella benthica]|uniref:UDP-N-acetylglucosamine--undecaprenyl-phosphate N-acetylglucosaminephosphotransferase n=1 Tax=Shewanella benthica TaxID=43661 RepID=UPI00187A333F|nr:UDP-N-acetylglucosamine--undecaprenyl-phosphate N-acetylglucosaminephosphotransferase [Shewanella benthica]MBE7213906.1 UDP-N-acetylglucosamine--undecaprenyl-phosphate N-acetylglucosaminephosphotransferase [Shewanella benthica]MCL1061812.1 UDP-N-acetylglucosamine--undecaprenyl-phosphate N-acetylglucosaminephosphotransferase [Shewanella benthica]
MSYLVPLICTFFISFYTIKFTKPLAVKIGLVDLPNMRKVHVGEIPLIGGISIYIGVLTTSMLFIDSSRELNIFLVAAAMVLFIGILDDRYDLSVRLRLVAQIIVASMMIFGTEIYLTSFGHIFGFIEFQLGPVGALVTIIAIIGGVNAFNMIDGIDGLAGMLSLVTFVSLAFLLGRVSNDWYMLPILFIASISAYLMFNLGWPSKSLQKIFMGDAGNMFIGLTVVWLLVVGSSAEVNAFRPVTALYLIAIPLMDMAAIMYRRIKKGGSPFKPDREHLHHIFERIGYTRKQTLALITTAGAALAFIGCAGDIYQVPEWIMFATFICIFSIYTWALSHIWLILKWLRK